MKRSIIDTAVFTTCFVLNDKKIITSVEHSIEDGSWIFLSEDTFDDFEKVARVVGFNEIMEIDPTLTELSKLKKGFMATRQNKREKWVITKL